MTSPVLLILGSLTEFTALVRLANEKGIRTVVADGNAGTEAKRLAALSFDVDVRDTEAIADICRKEGVPAITTGFPTCSSNAPSASRNGPAFLTISGKILCPSTGTSILCKPSWMSLGYKMQKARSSTPLSVMRSSRV